jgi:hypothetical protein
MNPMPRIFLTAMIGLLALSGCSRLFEKPEPVPRPVYPREAEPVTPPASERLEAPRAIPKSRPVPQVETPAAQTPAVAALLRDAEADRVSGNLDRAAATAERAIRIQPRNPLVWQQLAQIRLQQHQSAAAEGMAKKSNVLGAGNHVLVQRNWSIIAEARRQRGDTQGAADAEAKVGN